MPTVKVTKSDQTQKGKPYVCFDGKNNWQDFYYLGRDVARPEVGATIEANTSSKTFDDGKTIWLLNGWKPTSVPGSNPGPDGGSGNVGGSRLGDLKVTPSAKPNGGWNLETKDCAIILEVVLKAAFDKDRITDADDLFTWTAATYRAVEQLRSGKVRDFNDTPTPVSVTEAFPDDGLNGPIDEEEPGF